jgi:hypothetical protein
LTANNSRAIIYPNLRANPLNEGLSGFLFARRCLVAENDEGRMDYVGRRFAEAQSPEDVDQIRQELIADEGIPRGTIDRVKNDMRKTGALQGA